MKSNKRDFRKPLKLIRQTFKNIKTNKRDLQKP